MSGDGLVLEQGIRLSESMLWGLMAEYYCEQGADAWRDGLVPYRITTNAYLAEAYARIILNFLIDTVRDSEAPSGPIHVVELGTGHGRFAYMCLTKLLQLRKAYPLPLPEIRYVMTDITDGTMEAWEQSERFGPLFEAGVLDLARFSAESTDQLTLVRSGTVLDGRSDSAPTVFIANYFFDSMRQDVFRVCDGKLEEGRILLRSNRKNEPDRGDPSLMTRVELEYEFRPVSGEAYTEEPPNRILAEYARDLGNTAFCFPVGVFRCLDQMMKMCGGPLLLLSVDKGYSNLHQLLNRNAPGLVRSGTIISFMVNFHAVGRYVELLGGDALHASERVGSLETAALVYPGRRDVYPLTCLAFEEGPERFSPSDYFVLKCGLTDEESMPDLCTSLKILRMSCWDPDMLWALQDAFLDEIGEASDDIQAEALLAIMRVWENFFPVESYRDLPFVLGRILQRMRRYQQAAEFYGHSLSLSGVHPVTFNNLGVCQYRLGRHEEALEYFDLALEENPGYGSAREWRLRVMAEISGRGM